MISKIVPVYNILFRQLYVFQSCYNFAEESFKSNSQFKKQVLSLENCNTLQKVLSLSISQRNKPQTQQDNVELLKKLYKFSGYNRMWEKTSVMLGNIIKMDIANCNIVTLSYICGVTRLLYENSESSHQFIRKIVQKISQSLQQTNSKLNTENLINFLDFASQYGNKQLVEKICQKIQDNKYSILRHKYSLYVSNRKLPFEKQKQLFKVFESELENNIEKLQLKTIIDHYKNLTRCNKYNWKAKKAVELLENKIKNKINQMDEKQFNILMDFKSCSNGLENILIQKVFDEINDQGNTEIESQVVLRLMSKINSNHKFNVQQKDDKRVSKFLQKNIKEYSQVRQILKKDFLKRQSLVRILQQIKKSPQQVKKQYFQNLKFLQFLTGKRLNNVLPDNLEATLYEMIEKGTSKTNFIYLTVILARLNKEGKDKFIQKYPLIKSNLEELKTRFNYFFAFEDLSCPFNLIEQFHNRFSQYYLPEVLNSQKHQKYGFSNNMVNYLFVTRNYNEIRKNLSQSQKKIAQESQQFKQSDKSIQSSPSKIIHENKVAIIIKKVIRQPQQFENRFHFINQSLQLMLNGKNNLSLNFVKTVESYLCSEQVHAHHNEHEVDSLIKLAIKFCQNAKNKIQSENIFNSFSHSTSTFVSESEQYLELLNTFKNVYLQKDKLQNKDFYKIRNIFYEFLGQGILQKSLLKLILDQPQKHKQNFKILAADNIQEISERQTLQFLQLVSLVRSKNLTSEFQQKIKPLLQKSLNSLSKSNLINLILNFQMKWNSFSIDFMDMILVKVIQSNEFLLKKKLFLLMRKFQNFSSFSKEYIKLLQNFVNEPNRLKNISNISLATHKILMSEILRTNVPCERYTKRLIRFLTANDTKSKIQVSEKFDVLKLLISYEPEKCLQQFKYRGRSYREYRINFYNKLYLFDFKKQGIKESVIQIFKDIKSSDNKVVMNEGRFKYLAYLMPEIAQVQSKITLINPQKSELNEISECMEIVCKNNNIPYDIESKNGYKKLKIGQNIIFFAKQNYSERILVQLKEFFAFLFGAPLQNMKVFVTENMSKRRLLLKAICRQIPELKQFQTQLNQQLKKNNKKQDEEKKKKKVLYEQNNQKNSQQEKKVK